MHDSDLPKRNLLVIPGVLLLFYGLAATIYFEGVRSDDVPCDDGALYERGGVCYYAWKALLPAWLLGIALILVGLLVWKQPRWTADACRYPGTGTHVAFSLLLSWVLLPMLALLYVVYLQGSGDTTYEVAVGGATIDLDFLLELITLAALIPFVAFTGLLLQQGRMRRRLEHILLETDPHRPVHPMHEGHGARLQVAPVRDVKGSQTAYVDLDDQ